MECIYNQGFSLASQCLDNNIAGVKEFFIANYSGATSFEVDANNIITGATNGPATWFRIEQKKEQGTYDQNHAQSDNGQNVWTIDTEMVFFKNTYQVRDLVRVMAQTSTLIIAHRNDGQFIMIGEQAGNDMKTGNSGAGKAFEDFNGSRVFFNTKQGYEAREVSETFIGSLTIA